MRTSHTSLTTRRAVEDGETRFAREVRRTTSKSHPLFLVIDSLVRSAHESKLVAEKRRVDFTDFVSRLFSNCRGVKRSRHRRTLCYRDQHAVRARTREKRIQGSQTFLNKSKLGYNNTANPYFLIPLAVFSSFCSRRALLIVG